MAKPRARVELPHRLRHEVRRAVAQNLKPLLGVEGDELRPGVAGEVAIQINGRAVKPERDGVFGEIFPVGWLGHKRAFAGAATPFRLLESSFPAMRRRAPSLEPSW